MKKILEKFNFDKNFDYLIILNLLVLSYYLFISFTPIPDPTHYLVAHLNNDQIKMDKLNEIIYFIKTPIYLIIDFILKDLFFYTISSILFNLIFLNIFFLIINSFLNNKVISLIIVSSFIFIKILLAVFLYFDLQSLADIINLMMMNIDILNEFTVRQIFGLLFILSVYFFLKNKYYACNFIIFLNFFTHPNSNLISSGIFLLFYTFMFLKNQKEWRNIFLTYILLILLGISVKLVQIYNFEIVKFHDFSKNFYYNSMIKDEADDFSILWQITYRFKSVFVISFFIFMLNIIYLKIYEYDKLSFLSLSPVIIFILIGIVEYINLYIGIGFINNLIINSQPGWKLLGYSFIPVLLMCGKLIIKIDFFKTKIVSNSFVIIFYFTIVLLTTFGLTKNYKELSRFYLYAFNNDSKFYEDWLVNKNKNFNFISSHSDTNEDIVSLYPNENNIFKIKKLNSNYGLYNFVNYNEKFDTINFIKDIKNLVPPKSGIILPPNMFKTRGIFKDHYIFFVEHPDGNFGMGNKKFFYEVNNRMELLLNTNYNNMPNKQSGLNYSFIRQNFNKVDISTLMRIKKRYPLYRYIITENMDLEGADKLYNNEFFALYKF